LRAANLKVVSLGPPGARLRSRLLELIPAAMRASQGADLLVGGLEGAPIILATLCGWMNRRPTVGVVPTHLGRLIAAVRMGDLQRRLLVWALRRCGAVITASEDGRDALLAAGLRRDRVHVIANPVTPWAFQIVRQTEPQSPVRLLTVGRLEPVKGMDVVLEAAARLHDLSFRWEIVGDGPQGEALRALHAELGLGEKVHLAGRVEDLQPYFRRADCFVLASRLEGMSIAMLEAMATGLPIIATRSGRGVEEALNGGRAGTLVPADDSAALAAAVREVISQPERARAMGEAARLRARDYAPSTIAAAYGRVFDRVVAGGR
jgi:glycosyltransferase involved in cell wall biosynthesis